MAKRKESRTSKRLLAAAEKERQAVDLRMKRLPYREIAEALGYANESAARKAVERSMARTIEATTETADELRRIEIECLDRQHRRLEKQIEKALAVVAAWEEAGGEGEPPAFDPGMHARLEDSLTKVAARRASLLGLDAPKRAELTGKDGGPIPVEATWAGTFESAKALLERGDAE